MTTYLIVGNGVAGNSAAEVIRRLDPAGKIVLCSRERHYFYYTPALPEYVAGEKQLKDFTIHDAPWYEKNRIDLHLDTEVIQVDPRERSVKTRRGTSFSYDRLLLACGGRSFIPPIPGSSSPGVFTLRTVEDAEAICEAVERQRARLFVNYANRASSLDMATHYVLRQGLLGRVAYGEARLDDNISVPRRLWGGRSQEWAQGSSTAHFLLPHVVDLLRWHFSPAEVKEVYAVMPLAPARVRRRVVLAEAA